MKIFTFLLFRFMYEIVAFNTSESFISLLKIVICFFKKKKIIMSQIEYLIFY